MIVRFAGAGKSFKGLVAYLTHDPKAKTAERVDWTHTLNLTNDDIPAAVNEMLWTYRSADLLKQEAGIRAGGRRLEHPAKHVSFGWHPSEQPTKEEMIAAVETFLKHMGWKDHQAVLVAHNDKHYRHVHLMLNAVSPIDGRSLNTGYERVRASNWALEYERSQFRIHCEQRLKPYEEREEAPTRDAWLAMKEAEQQIDKEEARRAIRAPDYFERGDPERWQTKEWEALRAHQKRERMAFFAGGKQAYREVRNQVFREVKTEFRQEWRKLYSDKRKGLTGIRFDVEKADILAKQVPALEEKRDTACAELRAERDANYGEILRHQREQRAELRERQQQGLHSPQLFDVIYSQRQGEANRDPSDHADSPNIARFGKAADETCEPGKAKADEHETPSPEPFEGSAHENLRVRPGLDMAGGIGLGALGALGEIANSLLDGLSGGAPSKPKPQPASPRPNLKDERDRGARRAEAEIKGAEADEAARLAAQWEERRQGRRTRDRD